MFMPQAAQAITLDFSFRNLAPNNERVLVRPPVAITDEEDYDVINRGGQVNTSLLEMVASGKTTSLAADFANDPDIMMSTPLPQQVITSPERLVRPNEVITRRIEVPDDQVMNLSAAFATPVVSLDDAGNVEGTGQFFAPNTIEFNVDEAGNFMDMEQVFTDGNLFTATDDGNGMMVANRPFPDGNQPLLELRVTQVDDSQAVPGPTPLLGLAAIAGTAGFLKVRRKGSTV